MKKAFEYPILDNRPINQWKVTELKEELKRRRLTVGGLKHDLIKRLKNAIHSEREAAQEEENVHNENEAGRTDRDHVEDTDDSAGISKQTPEVDPRTEQDVDLNFELTIQTNQSVNDTGEAILENLEQKTDHGKVTEVNIDSKVKDKSLVKEKSALLIDIISVSNAPDVDDIVTNDIKLKPDVMGHPHESKDTENAEMSQKNCSAYSGSGEKLNLDRSSGDDSISMYEDALESKEISSEEVAGEKNELTKGESLSATVDVDLIAEEKNIYIENKDDLNVSPEKRKVTDEETILNNESSKRQCMWKSESFRVKEEPQISNNIGVSPIKDTTSSPVLRRCNLSESSYAGATANKAHNESEVPPSTKKPTNSLRIDRFQRPFTLKSVQELLSKTGTVACFWMDNIKTHCYVTYSSVEEAAKTKNAIYNLQWPPNGGRNLIADFVDPQEVKTRPQTEHRRTPPPPPPTPIPYSDIGVESPIMTLDYLFRKTKTTPRIYYLPLSQDVYEARPRNSTRH